MNRLYGCLLLVLLAWSCQSSSEPPAPAAQPEPGVSSAPQAPAGQTRTFKLDGEVISVDKDKKTAVVKHGDIEGFMAAMTMPYPVPEQSDIDKIKAGDHITATVYDEPAQNRMWLGNIQVEDEPNP
jgi:protein SCO1/2